VVTWEVQVIVQLPLGPPGIWLSPPDSGNPWSWHPPDWGISIEEAASGDAFELPSWRCAMDFRCLSCLWWSQHSCTPSRFPQSKRPLSSMVSFSPQPWLMHVQIGCELGMSIEVRERGWCSVIAVGVRQRPVKHLSLAIGACVLTMIGESQPMANMSIHIIYMASL